MASILRLASLVALAGLAACSKDNPYYCEDNPAHNCTLDAGTSSDPDTLTTCTSDDTCGGTTPACNLDTNTCVQCTATNAMACTGTKPICETNACRGCTMNAECASGACMQDGSCAAEGSVLFASSTGGATSCAATDKCSLETAIAAADTTKKNIVLDPGEYATTGSVTIGKEITLVARQAVIIKGGASEGPVFNVTTGGRLTVYYAEIKNGDGDSLGNGITCMGGAVTVQFASIHANAATGISSTSCSLTVDRSKLYANTAGGIALLGTTSPVFTITNNFIYQNGNNTLSQFGGVKIGLSGVMPGSIFEFNTIVDNFALSTSSYSGGVVCNVTGFAAPNNIIVHNSYGGATNHADANSYGVCTYPTSIKQESLTELAFGSTTGTYDLRIGASSIAKDAATTASDVTVDFEGDDRPQNGISDIGADELK